MYHSPASIMFSFSSLVSGDGLSVVSFDQDGSPLMSAPLRRSLGGQRRATDLFEATWCTVTVTRQSGAQVDREDESTHLSEKGWCKFLGALDEVGEFESLLRRVADGADFTAAIAMAAPAALHVVTHVGSTRAMDAWCVLPEGLEGPLLVSSAPTIWDERFIDGREPEAFEVHRYEGGRLCATAQISGDIYWESDRDSDDEFLARVGELAQSAFKSTVDLATVAERFEADLQAERSAMRP